MQLDNVMTAPTDHLNGHAQGMPGLHAGVSPLRLADMVQHVLPHQKLYFMGSSIPNLCLGQSQ